MQPDTLTIYNYNYKYNWKRIGPDHIAKFKKIGGSELFESAVKIGTERRRGYEITLQRADGTSSTRFVTKKMAMEFISSFTKLGMDCELNHNHPDLPKKLNN